ncbi:hypothetical protein DIZ81_01925 [Legionella taurinensis]|uniref:Lipoprotein n=1 Tax=Legionella taurinensis TaxID=70611 RepID=A0A3A5L7J3_9GAMM|nr:hypothetical protein DB744_01930 [Legionella taurinensis]PUT44668.1 hypothetical protein DB746_01930 [Legionella taurinensis]PUT47988.1 hypothetical protein DB743_00090 [Legionella taurinensis]PUT48802.1 hypothetical protein DB745_01930 [Legionella taurinensis]RJT45872.1 hypothetical protein D6J04_09740 [Legionella taurinensis]
MKKLILLSSLSLSAFMLSSCTVTSSTYSPGYNSDYVYSVGYYGYRPYWGSYYSSYYPGVTWRNSYWYGNRSLYGGYYGSSYGVGLFGRRW